MEGGLLGFILQQQPGAGLAAGSLAAMRLLAEQHTAAAASANAVQPPANQTPVSSDGRCNERNEAAHLAACSRSECCAAHGSMPTVQLQAQEKRFQHASGVQFGSCKMTLDPCWHLDLSGRTAAAGTQTRAQQPPETVTLFDDFGVTRQQKITAAREPSRWHHATAAADAVAAAAAPQLPEWSQNGAARQASAVAAPGVAIHSRDDSPAPPAGPNVAQRVAPRGVNERTCRVCHRQYVSSAVSGAGRSLENDLEQALLAALQGEGSVAAASTPWQVGQSLDLFAAVHACAKRPDMCAAAHTASASGNASCRQQTQ